MVRKLLLGLSLVISFFVNAQQSKIDSLTLEFNTVTTDTAKARILNDIGVLAYRVNFEYAKEINDSLISFSREKSDKYLIKGYRMKGSFNLLDGDYEKAIFYYLEAMELAQKTKDFEIKAALLENLGTLYVRQGDNEKAIEHYLESIKVNNKINGNSESNIRLYINLSIAVGRNNELHQSVEYLIKALKLAEKHNSAQKHNIHNSLAIKYLALDSYEKAELHLKTALPIAEEQNDNSALASINNSYGYLYEARDDDFDNAYIHYKKSLKFYTLMHDKRRIIIANYNVGLQPLRFGRLIEAKKYFKEGLKLAESLNSIPNMIIGNLHLEHLSLENKNIKKALFYSRISDSLLKSNKGSRMPYRNHFFRLSEAYKKNGKYKRANENMERYARLTDSLFKENGTLKIAEIETKYQTEKKEKELAQQRESIKKQELITERTNRQKWIFGIGLLGSLIALSIFAFYYRKNKRQKQTIELLHKDLHHRVKNNLSVIDTFIEVAKEEFNDDTFDKKLTELQNRIYSINEVHLQLYNNSNVTSLNVQKYIQSLSENIQQSFAQKNIAINQNIEDTLTLNAYTSFPFGLIVNEFITNSYKHAFENEVGIIDIALHETNTHYKLSLSDNGKGLPKDFDIKETSSFGLRIMKLLSLELNGKFDLKSDNGVHLNIQFPK